MSIISKGGRKSGKIRLIYAMIYLILIVGTVMMVYPFLLMLSSSLTSPFDFDDLKLIPKYLVSDDALLKKHLFAKYGRENFRRLRLIYHRDRDWSTWNVIREEKNFLERNFSEPAVRYAVHPAACQQLVSDWNAFKQTLPPQDIAVFFPDNYDAYRDFLRNKYLKICKQAASDKFSTMDNDQKTAAALRELNSRWQRAFNNFAEILPLKCFPTEQKWAPPQRQDFSDLLAYHQQLPPEQRAIIPSGMLWALYLEKKFISPENFTRQTGIKLKQFSDLTVFGSNKEKFRPLWEEFLRKKYPLRLVKIHGDFTPQWREQLKNEFKTVAAFNKQTGMHIAVFSELKFPSELPENPIIKSIWQDFILEKVPLSQWSLNRPVELYRTFLAEKYRNITALNKAYAVDYNSFDQIPLPLKLVDYIEFSQNKNAIRRTFLTANYAQVIKFLFTKGRSVLVTVLLVAFSILGALTVNPLAAYALSRGRQSTSAKFLIFFLATMAFPAEVAMIPGFLLLRDLGLLNTLAALVLPGLANGYSIFLLKGFFDSVPKELYEAADIDGAGEFTKFWRITFPMSKPILAVIALSAFTLAYGGFMWAFLTCQNPKMWTIMVWLYDFQSRYANEPGMCMAAFALASVPTLLVFLFCQKIIMRGIIIPTMK